MVQPFILGMQILAMVMLAASSSVAGDEVWRYMLLAMPALAAGVFIGFLLFAKVNQERFRAVILWLLVISGVLMAV
jgi:uncharacterized membrane protein YfcA